MLNVSTRNQFIIGVVLVLLLITTRGHYLGTLHNLPSASWAVFFLAGVYVRPCCFLPGLLSLAWTLDFAAYVWGNASAFCLTSAYIFLLPAYSALWLAGRWYANLHHFAWPTLLPLAAALTTSAVICELLSSGGYYFFSGRFTEPTFTEFGIRLLTYFPSYLQSLTIYVVIAAIAHTIFALLHSRPRTRNVAV